MRILVTGAAGFIGFHMARRLLERGDEVIGIDGMTPYYDVALKAARLESLDRYGRFYRHELMLEDFGALRRAYGDGFDIIYHFAAQAGVRYSLENPRAYVDANLLGTYNLLELMRSRPPRHALLASTSSVYGANAKMPFVETDRADHPLTLYAASKKAGEDMAHSYSHLFAIPTTMLRFFTVYGPWGRPDMALFKFVSSILHGEPIELYNQGKMRRDFTYVDDLVEAMLRLLHNAPPAPGTSHRAIAGDSLSPVAPWRVVNIGAGHPVDLEDFVAAVERALGTRAQRKLMPMQPGDVPATFANTDLLDRLTAYRPATSIDVGVPRFVEWYRTYYDEKSRGGSRGLQS